MPSVDFGGKQLKTLYYHEQTQRLTGIELKCRTAYDNLFDH